MLTSEVAPTPPRAAARRTRVPASLVIAAPVMVVVLVVAVLATGAGAGVLSHTGALVRWGLPVVQGLRDLAVSVLLGALLLLATALVPGTPAWGRVARLSAGAAVVWVLSAVALPVLTFADIADLPLSAPGITGQLGFFLGSVETGRLLLTAALLALVAGTVAAVGVTTASGAAWAAVLTAAALVPLALSTHSGSTGGHRTAVSAWWLHGLGVGAWTGGLVALVVAGPVLGSSLAVVARRYSALALGSFVLVVVSGVANGWVQVGSTAAGLASPYGALLGVYSHASVLLGAAGWQHRRRTLAALEDGAPAGSSRGFWRLAGAEVVVMAATIGVAVALVRTGPPDTAAGAGPQSLAAQATDEPVPPLPLTFARAFTVARPDLLWLVIAAALVLCYAVALHRLHARGDRWSPGRAVSWFAGCAVLAWVTSVGPTAYADLLFSAHMINHMVVMMVVPPLLVAGAPVTLAVRTLRRRSDGSRGPREWLLVLVHSRVATFLASPVVAAVLFAGSLVVFYYSPLFALSLSTHLGHELMQVHFLATGYLFTSAIIGIDPGTTRASHPMRLLLLLATMAFHAFFGVSLLAGNSLLAARWFTELGLGVDALADQRTGGGIAWGIGEFPTIVLAVVLAVQWSRSDERESRRGDRAADRDDDAALAAYNRMLAARSELSDSGGGWAPADAGTAGASEQHTTGPGAPAARGRQEP